MPEGLAELPSGVIILLVVTGISWMLSAIFWHYQRYYLLRLFRSNWWRRAKTRTQEIAFHEKLARRVARSVTWRVVSAATGIALIALGVIGLSMKH
jgi:hypothetical protein